jgi:hypothetical protein
MASLILSSGLISQSRVPNGLIEYVYPSITISSFLNNSGLFYLSLSSWS